MTTPRDTLYAPWCAYRYLEALIGVPWVMKNFIFTYSLQLMRQYCCKAHKCGYFYSFSKQRATLGTLYPGPAAQGQSQGQNDLWTLRCTPEEAISEIFLKFCSHSSDICKKCNFCQNINFVKN